MLARAERRLANPACSLRAHLRVTRSIAIHPLCHVVTPDTGERAAAFRHPGRRVVRTARAKVWPPLEPLRCGFRHLQERIDPPDTRGQRRLASPIHQTMSDYRRDLIAVQSSRGGKQRPADLVALADDAGRAGNAVHEILQLILYETSFLFYDDHEVEPSAKTERRFGLERPRHRDLVDGEPETLSRRRIDAQIDERLAHIEVGLARGDDPDARAVLAKDDAIEAIGATECTCRLNIVISGGTGSGKTTF